MVVTAFFSSGYVDPRDLHSFPTRRSSDLGIGNHGSRAVGHRTRNASGIGLSAEQARRERAEQTDARVSDCHRSEEHTSELQSQFHLVCRLLLEKKKKHE